MTDKIKNEKIFSILQEHTNGATIDDLYLPFSRDMSKRTFLRHLSKLKISGKIIVSGKAQSTRYHLGSSKSGIIISPSGQEIKSQVRAPIQQRKPVAYQQEFLYRYKPNETFYLPEATRKHLHSIGKLFEQKLTPGTYAKRILHRLLIDLSWNSSRLEGNTYSLLETQRLIEFGAEADAKHTFETRMILNHKNAIEFIVEQADHLIFTPAIIQNIHAFLSNGLLANPKARGQLRNIPVGIGKTVYQPPEIPQLIGDCFEHILLTANKITDPFEQAFFVTVHLPYLQPFEDVNKRVSRLAANIPLIKNNFSPLTFIDVPKDDYISGLLGIYEINRYELMRDVFVWAYERSTEQYQVVQETIGQPDLFYIKYNDELEALINLIISQNIHGKAMIIFIEKWAKDNIQKPDQIKFYRTAETELASLHEGNIAIYHLNIEDFKNWQKHTAGKQ